MRAGWYPSPDDPTELKYWDGEGWTEHTQASPDAPGAESDAEAEPLADADPNVQPPDAPDEESAVPWLDGSSAPSDDDGWDDGPESRSALGWIIGALATSAIVIGGFVVFSALWDGGDSSTLNLGAITGDGIDSSDAVTTSTLAQFVAPTTTRFAIASTTTTTVEATTTTSAAISTTTAPAERQVTLLVDVAKLRAGPRLTAAEVDTITDLGGTTIVALGEPVDGWYEVRIGTQQGWIFGAFILPPADGLTVVQTRSGVPVTLLNVSGQALGVENAAGSYALATSTSGDLWPVILPEGGVGYVNAADMKTRS